MNLINFISHLEYPKNKPTGGNPSKLVSPREVSNIIMNRKAEYDVSADTSTSMLFVFWGSVFPFSQYIVKKKIQLKNINSHLPQKTKFFCSQLVDHSTTFSFDTSIYNQNDCVPFNIPIPKGDLFYDRFALPL